jgi:hypothetical protein
VGTTHESLRLSVPVLTCCNIRSIAYRKQQLAVKVIACYCVVGYLLTMGMYLGYWCHPVEEYWAVPVRICECTCKDSWKLPVTYANRVSFSSMCNILSSYDLCNSVEHLVRSSPVLHSDTCHCKVTSAFEEEDISVLRAWAWPTQRKSDVTVANSQALPLTLAPRRLSSPSSIATTTSTMLTISGMSTSMWLRLLQLCTSATSPCAGRYSGVSFMAVHGARMARQAKQMTAICHGQEHVGGSTRRD